MTYHEGKNQSTEMPKMVELINKDIRPVIKTEFNMLKKLEKEIKKYTQGRDI